MKWFKRATAGRSEYVQTVLSRHIAFLEKLATPQPMDVLGVGIVLGRIESSITVQSRWQSTLEPQHREVLMAVYEKYIDGGGTAKDTIPQTISRILGAGNPVDDDLTAVGWED